MEPEKDPYGRPWPDKEKLVPRTAADCIITRPSKSGFEVMLITRKKPGPSQGKHAFPGGHIDYNEDPKVAAVRELEEECGIKGCEPELFTVRGAPDRDDRYHMISIFYLVKLIDGTNQEPVAQDDAASASWYDVKEILAKPEIFAFDHHEVLSELVSKNDTYASIR